MAERSGDTAFDLTEALGASEAAEITLPQSGVAPVFPLAAALPYQTALRGRKSNGRLDLDGEAGEYGG